MLSGNQNRLYTIILVIISLAGYLYMGYFVQRHQTIRLLLCYAGLFGSYVILCYIGRDSRSHIWHTGLALFSRLCLIASVPALSDDVYRFIWDGELLASGYDPFGSTPAEYAGQGLLAENEKLAQLFPMLNSPGYYTIYPPLCQFVFYLSAVLNPSGILGSIVIIRLFILLAEGITLFVLPRLLKVYGISERVSLVYALNPLVVLELTGNLHFEAWAIAGLLLTLFFWKKNKSVSAGISIAIAVLAKLLPLITLPLFLRRLSFFRMALFYGTVGMCILLALIPYLDSSLVEGMTESASLYFNKFEFNASLYYLVRQAGYWYKGYNIIATAGTSLALVAGIGILLYAVAEWKIRVALPVAFMWVYAIYYLCATTLHPWYVLMLLPLCLFGRWRFPVVWTALVFMTYVGYTAGGFTENLWITALEYIILVGWIIYEGVWDRKRANWRLWKKIF